MPITEDTFESEILEPPILLGQVNILRRQLDARFCPVPNRFAKRNHIEPENLGVRLLTAASLPELFA